MASPSTPMHLPSSEVAAGPGKVNERRAIIMAMGCRPAGTVVLGTRVGMPGGAGICLGGGGGLVSMSFLSWID